MPKRKKRDRKIELFKDDATDHLPYDGEQEWPRLGSRLPAILTKQLAAVVIGFNTSTVAAFVRTGCLAKVQELDNGNQPQ